MLQTVIMQYLANFGQQEGYRFEFQSSGDWKSLKRGRDIVDGEATPPLDTTPCGRVLTRSCMAQYWKLASISLHSRACLALHCCPPLCSPSPAVIGASHCHPSWGKDSPSSPLPLAQGWSSSPQSSTPSERVHRAAFFFRVLHRRPPRFNLLRANRPYRKLPHRSPLLPDPRFYAGSHWSTLSSSAISLPTALPSISHTGEPLSSQQPPIDSLWDKLPPQLLLLHHLTAGWLESIGGAVPVKGGRDSLFQSTGLKGFGGPEFFSWLGRVHYRTSLLALCHLLFSMRIIQINSIQIRIWFELWKFVET
jgi:hypothetical protein